jgi:transposase
MQCLLPVVRLTLMSTPVGSERLAAARSPDSPVGGVRVLVVEDDDSIGCGLVGVPHLVVERLPGYAPDLNPSRGWWGNVKGTELANLCADSIDEPAQAAHAGIDRVRADNDLAFAFLGHCGLSL